MTAASRTPRRTDVAIAAGCWVCAIGAMLVLPVLAASSQEPIPGASFLSPTWWLTAATVTIQSILLLWSRNFSRAVVGAVTTTPVVLAVIAPGAIFSVTSLAALIAVYLAVIRRPPGRLSTTLIAAAVMIAVGHAVNSYANDSSGVATALIQAILQAAAVVLLPMLLGTVVAARRDARIAHTRELRALASERDALVRAAVADERAAMARELHDIAAHHLSGIALMAAVTERQIAADPDAARESVQQIRAQARSVLDDLRRLVGLLRHDNESPQRSVETLAEVPALVLTRCEAGADVRSRILGAEDIGQFAAGLGPLTQLVIYRMIQESLANAARHAAGAQCSVELDGRDSRHVTVTVSNTAVPAHSPHFDGSDFTVSLSSTAARTHIDSATSGFGLVGMSERAALVGGSLQYGPCADGGWTVVLTLPRRSDAAVTPGV